MARIGRGWLSLRQYQVPQCVAYREDGKLCREVATVLDTQRGGMVCEKHAPKDEKPPEQTLLSL